MRADGEGVRIVIQDEGEGMAPEVLERIRKPYFTTKAGGTGLGVAVARGIIEQHGGRIEYFERRRAGNDGHDSPSDEAEAVLSFAESAASSDAVEARRAMSARSAAAVAR